MKLEYLLNLLKLKLLHSQEVMLEMHLTFRI